MSGKPRYLSPEWKEQVEALLRSELTPEKMNHITSSMSNIYLNCPDGKERFMYFGFADGNLDRFLVEEGEAPQAEFKITGDYETFAKISRAEMNGGLENMTAPSPTGPILFMSTRKTRC
ncbi:MAG: sterol-binding protein [Firmicutes bacterium]|nr:sterol-binding protein [Bacillota bacterium]